MDTPRWKEAEYRRWDRRHEARKNGDLDAEEEEAARDAHALTAVDEEDDRHFREWLAGVRELEPSVRRGLWQHTVVSDDG